MIWTIDQEPERGILFRGQSSVRVVNRKGVRGIARVIYTPTCQVVGPVIPEEDYDEEPDPTHGLEILDKRPTFRCQ